MFSFGRCKINYTSAANTVPLRLKSASQDDQEKQISLLELCKSVTPPCKLNPLLFNGHMQTTWLSLTSLDVPVHYKRRIFESDNKIYKGTFAVDFVVPKPATPVPEDDPYLTPRTSYFSDSEWKALEEDDDGSKPLLLVLHGLSGGSDELYVRLPIHEITSGPGGWAACVVNFRGCANSKITTPYIYNGRATWDYRQVVKWARQRWPKRRLYAMGFSLGANILYLGEEGSSCQIEAAVVVSNPWNLELAAYLLDSTWLARRAYSETMATSLRDIFDRHSEQLLKVPGIDAEKVRGSKYIFHFDRAVQCPLWGYPTETAYYRDASSTDALLSMRIPVLCIHAEDDPIAHDKCVPYEEIKKNPNVVMCASSGGGHLGWFGRGGSPWYSQTSTSFLQKVFNETDGAVRQEELNGKPEGGFENGAEYIPMRRKLWLATVDE